MRLIGPLLFVFALAGTAEATTYYVRTDGNNGNDGLSNTAAGAWLTITYATDNVSAGDSIRVQGTPIVASGDYVETATPSASGTSGNTVTIVADGVVTTCGMTFTNVSYIRLIGFTFDGNLSGCTLAANRVSITGTTNTGLEFWNNTIENGNTAYSMSNATFRCASCIIVGGSISNVNNGQTGIAFIGNDAFIGYVALDSVDYLGVVATGARSRFVNLNFSNFIQIEPRHPDFFFPGAGMQLGHSNTLIESMLGIGTPTAEDNKVMHLSNNTGVAWEDNIWRNSVSYNMGSGFYSGFPLSGAIYRYHFYNNTLVKCIRGSAGAKQCGSFVQQTNPSVLEPITATVKNTIFEEAWSADQTTNLTVWTEQGPDVVVTANYNLADDRDGPVTFASTWWNNQANKQDNVDPVFVDGDADWTLQSSSGARGVGGPLTTATSCSGTTLNVAAGTGGMFIPDNSANLPQYGGALVPGDFLTINGTTYQVLSRSTDALTLNTSLTCSNGDLVYFGSTSTIDIGAYPYKAGGYTLSATYTNSGGTVTITPNDASLVRFAVCYNDDVPHEVDNSSPYTCSTPSGVVSVNVYPRYASTTLWAEATEAAAAAVGPTRPFRIKGHE